MSHILMMVIRKVSLRHHALSSREIKLSKTPTASPLPLYGRLGCAHYAFIDWLWSTCSSTQTESTGYGYLTALREAGT